MRAALRNNSLSLFFLTIFLAALLAQSLVGHTEYNHEQRAHEQPTISWARYVASSEFGEAVMENWQSEFLQFALFIFATVWLVQRGSNESKELDQVGLESDEQQKHAAELAIGIPRGRCDGGVHDLPAPARLT
jgi:hypothetical protein